MLMLLSPAKSQDFDTSITASGTQPQLKQHTQALAKILKHYSKTELSKLMNISEKLADLNYQRFQDFSDTYTKTNAKPCVYAFQGDAYKGLAIDDFSNTELDFLQQHLIILSGLYGALKPLDLIQPYRLEMKTPLSTDQGSNLYQFWGDTITQLLNKTEQDTIINLASNEYFKAIQPKALTAQLIHCDFKENKQGQYKTIGIHAKRARGLMVRYAAKHNITQPEQLKQFNLEGYQLNGNLTDNDHWVFTRD